MTRYILPALLFFVSLCGNATVYENKNNQAGITYSDIPTPGSKPAVIPDVNIVPAFTPYEKPKAVEALQFKSGTGFFVNKTYLITNAHVIDGCDKVFIKGPIAQHEVSVEMIDTQHDLALLKTDMPSQQYAPMHTNIDDLHVGDPVYFIGYPERNGVLGKFSFVKSHIVNLGNDIVNNHNWFYVTDVVEKGDSGGPVLDQDGNVIGVIVAKGILAMINERTQQTLSSKNVGMVISLKTLRDFLYSYGIYSGWGISNLFHDDAYIEEHAKDYIVNVQCHMSENGVR